MRFQLHLLRAILEDILFIHPEDDSVFVCLDSLKLFPKSSYEDFKHAFHQLQENSCITSYSEVGNNTIEVSGIQIKSYLIFKTIDYILDTRNWN